MIGLFVGVATLLGMTWARFRPANPERARTHAATLAVTVAICAAITVAAACWQNLLRGAFGLPAIGIDWIAAVTISPVAVVAALVCIPRAVLGAATLAIALIAGFTAPAMSSASNEHRGVRTAAQTAPEPFPGIVFRDHLSDVPLDVRARMIVDRWVADGGLDRRAVVIAVPTGSGWVDGSAIEGFRTRFGDDVALLALPYANVPSWQAFIGDREAAGRSATALLRTVTHRLAQRPHGHRPELLLYGQSLGAVGADVARIWAEHEAADLPLTTLLTAPPDDSVTPRSATPRRVLANPSDPVVRWSFAGLWRPPHTPDDAVSVGRRTPRPPWFPIASFVTTSIDLLTALDGPTGTGHRYGTEQTGLTCGRPVASRPR